MSSAFTSKSSDSPAAGASTASSPSLVKRNPDESPTSPQTSAAGSPRTPTRGSLGSSIKEEVEEEEEIEAIREDVVKEPEEPGASDELAPGAATPTSPQPLEVTGLQCVSSSKSWAQCRPIIQGGL